MKPLTWIILVVIVAGALFLFLGNSEDIDIDVAVLMENTEITKDKMSKNVEGAMKEEMMKMTHQYSGVLTDVTGGKDIRGVNTKGESSGVAQASFVNGEYSLLVSFANLPDPQGSDFYEGWLVRKGSSFDVISAGVVDKIDGIYMNLYSSGDDLLDHDFYVLTLEPDDGNPAPADHISEGTLIKL